MFNIKMKTSFRSGPEPKLPIKCPKCGKVSQHRFSELKDGSEIKCSCGTTSRISGDGFKTAGQALKNFGKK